MSDAGKIKYLGKTLLKLEIRSSDGSLKKLFLINLSFLLPGIFIPWLLNTQKVSPFEFTFITFLLFSLLMIFTMINEIDNILLSKNESEIFSSLPVGPKILSGAKIFMLTRFTLLMSLPLFIPSSVFYYLISGSLSLMIVYIINGYVSAYFLTNIILLLYASAVRNFRITRSGNFRLLIQLIMIITLILGFQFISYGITGKNSISSFINWLIRNRVMDFIPSSWFALALSAEKYVFNLSFLVKITTPYLIFFFSYLSLRNYLQENYNIISENLILCNSVRKKNQKYGIFNLLSDYFEKIYLRNSSQLASYGLMKAMMRKDKTLRTSIFPVMILPAALALFGLITDQLPDPFRQGYLQSKPVFHISVLLSVIVVLNTALLSMRISNNPEASWIYQAFPMREKADFISGIRKFFSLNFVLPVTLSVLIITLFSIEFRNASVNALFILSSAILYNSVFFFFSRHLPFTEENTTLNSIKRLASLVNPFIFGIFIVILQSLVYDNLQITLITILIMLIATYLINISARHVLRKASFNLSAHLK